MKWGLGDGTEAHREAASVPIQQARELVQEFFRLARERQGETLRGWIARVAAAGHPELVTFARALDRDWEAVVAGLTLPWSNGPTEGQIHRLKLLQRPMDERASLALLRGRVLPRAVAA